MAACNVPKLTAERIVKHREHPVPNSAVLMINHAFQLNGSLAPAAS
jgi:hypothetical protein